MRPLRAALAAAALAVPLALLPVSGASAARSAPEASPPTRVVADCVHYRVEPRRLLGACGDGNEYAVVRHYASWTDTLAVGRGTLVVNDCDPDCAAGTAQRFPARFVVDHPVSTRHGRVFTQVRVTFPRHPHGRPTVIDLPRRPLA